MRFNYETHQLFVICNAEISNSVKRSAPPHGS